MIINIFIVYDYSGKIFFVQSKMWIITRIILKKINNSIE